MFRLLSIELHKLKHHRSTKILLILYFLLLSAGYFLNYFSIGGNANQILDSAKKEAFEFPFIWHLITFIAKFLQYFLVLIVISMMANEYNYRTLKQNLIDGLSKRDFLTSKFLAITLLALTSTVVIALVGLSLGFRYSEIKTPEVIFKDLSFLGGYFLELLALFSLAFFLTLLIKKPSFVIACLFFLYIIELTLRAVIGKYIEDEQISSLLAKILPLRSTGNLISNPLKRLENVQTMNDSLGLGLSKDYHIQPENVLILLVWTTVFILGSYFILKKRDL